MNELKDPEKKKNKTKKTTKKTTKKKHRGNLQLINHGLNTKIYNQGP